MPLQRTIDRPGGRAAWALPGGVAEGNPARTPAGAQAAHRSVVTFGPAATAFAFTARAAGGG
jgi:hypothetical protein